MSYLPTCCFCAVIDGLDLCAVWKELVKRGRNISFEGCSAGGALAVAADDDEGAIGVTSVDDI